MPTYVVRMSASPSAGCGAGTETSSVSSGATRPVGRRRNRIWRFISSTTIVKLPVDDLAHEALARNEVADDRDDLRDRNDEQSPAERRGAEVRPERIADDAGQERTGGPDH